MSHLVHVANSAPPHLPHVKKLCPWPPHGLRRHSLSRVHLVVYHDLWPKMDNILYNVAPAFILECRKFRMVVHMVIAYHSFFFSSLSPSHVNEGFRFMTPTIGRECSKIMTFPKFVDFIFISIDFHLILLGSLKELVYDLGGSYETLPGWMKDCFFPMYTFTTPTIGQGGMLIPTAGGYYLYPNQRLETPHPIYWNQHE